MIFATVLPFLQILRISNDFTSYSLERSEWKSGSITFIRCSATGYGQFWPRLSLSLDFLNALEFMEFDATFQKWNCPIVCIWRFREAVSRKL